MDDAALAEIQRKARFKEYKYDEKKSSIVLAKTKESLIEREAHWADWFKEPMFYQYGFVYMGARICMNIASVSNSFLFKTTNISSRWWFTILLMFLK